MRIKTKVCPDIKEGYANSKSPRGAISEVYLELMTLTNAHGTTLRGPCLKYVLFNPFEFI